MKLHRGLIGTTLSLPIFFALKIASGVGLLKIATVYLSVANLSVFFQFLLFGALLNMVTVGGIQNGFIRLIASSDSEVSDQRAIKAAMVIWMITFFIACIPVILLRGPVSILLIDSEVGSWAVIWITLVTFMGGPGIVLCGVLTGKGRAPASLLAQGIGLVAGTAACIVFLVKGQPLTAATSFYTGSLLTLPIAWILHQRTFAILLIDKSGYRDEIIMLLKYSGAFIFLAVSTSLTLFGLRYVYQSIFDAEALGYWMVAQRVSDTSMQLLGLFMVQLFIPQYAAAKTALEKTRIFQKSWLAVTVILSIFLALFAIAPELIVHVFLSEKYLPAIYLIMIYMLGDIFRGTVSLAMHTAFADGRLIRYMGIEFSTTMLFAIIMFSLIAWQNTRLAPILSYAGAYGTSFLIVVLLFAVTRLKPRAGAGSTAQ